MKHNEVLFERLTSFKYYTPEKLYEVKDKRRDDSTCDQVVY